MRKLGILVVYAFEECDKPLFDLHISYIRKHTPTGYTIYGAVNGLSADMRAHLSLYPEIKQIVCDEVPSKLPSCEEHAALIEALARRATVDGCENLFALHLESFPVAPNWVAEIERALGRGASFAALVPHRYSACLAWTHEFQLEGASLLIPKNEMNLPSYHAFQTALPTLAQGEPGIGFIYHAWRRGLDWQGIDPVSKYVFGGYIFHLRAGLKFAPSGLDKSDTPTSENGSESGAERLFKLAKPLLNTVPASVRGVLKKGPELAIFEPYRPSLDQESANLSALLEDPEAFIHQ